MFHKVHPCKESENQRVSWQALSSEILSNHRQECSWIGDFHAVVKHFYGYTCALFIIVAMGKRIDDSFLEYLQWDFPNFFSRSCTFNLVCNLQFAFQPFYSFIVLLKERAAKSLVVNNVHFVRSLKQHTAYNCMEKHILWMLGKKQHPATFSNIIVIKDHHTVKYLKIVHVRNYMGFSLELQEVVSVQLLQEVDFRQRDGIKVYTLMALEYFSYFFHIRQLLAICPFAQIRTSRKEIGLVLAWWHFYHPYFFSVNIHIIHVVVTHGRYFTYWALYCRPFTIVYLCTDNLVVVVNSNEQITTSSIQETTNFFCKFANFWWYTPLKVYIISLSSID